MSEAAAGAIVTLYSTFGSEEEARRVARQLVEERLAACANVLAPCHSVYRWQSEVEEAQEVPVLFKTRADRAAAAIARIGALHSYDVPAAVAWPIADALDSYRQWIVDES
ncbi:divalent-cation tolerance protein CutA [Sphingosinicella terrae]|jgi:periplasmic divalent cation tolerance protein|uniref:divalent-cation tolerance protein CutA n=1 Tax=Sphingosinicella terrae TaxID=2172047 RepID=UPI000E0CF523|nr:divalent-cation tolerance protein CutA [Sphingosinicella terrae]